MCDVFFNNPMTKSVLFLCTGNSCRSHMAEGLTNHFLADTWTAVSAGTEPAGYVHPLAIAALAELGIDISQVRGSGGGARSALSSERSSKRIEVPERRPHLLRREPRRRRVREHRVKLSHRPRHMVHVEPEPVVVVGVVLGEPPDLLAGALVRGGGAGQARHVREAVGQDVQLQASGNDPDGDRLFYHWDLDDDGSYETEGAQAQVSYQAVGDWCAGHGLPESRCLDCNPGLAEATGGGEQAAPPRELPTRTTLSFPVESSVRATNDANWAT